MAPQESPSERQMDVLEFIWKHFSKYDRPPTYRDIRDAIGAKAVSNVSYHVKKLKRQGLLVHEDRVARGLSLTDEARRLVDPFYDSTMDGTQLMRLRIQGDIRAGEPVDFGNDLFATYDEDDTVAIDGALLPGKLDNLTAFRVRGNSMIDALIQDRDIVVLQPVVEARNGDMVAAWLQLEQELTLKHFYREGDQVRLQPANAAMAPIFASAANVQVQGKVVLVIRNTGG